MQFGRAIYSLIIYLLHSIILECNGFIVELVIICVYVCLLCQYTQFQWLSCLYIVCVSDALMKFTRGRIVLALEGDFPLTFPQLFNSLSDVTFSLMSVVVVVFVFAIDLGRG